MTPAGPARLAARPFAAADAPAVAALAGDPAVADAMISIPHPLSAAGAAALLAAYAREAAAGRAYHAAVCRAVDGVLVGGVALRDVDPEHRTAELSFWVGRPWWGRGYAPEAGALALAAAFGELALNRVAAYHVARNAASAAVLRKLGFRREGLLEQRVYKAGRFEDVLAYAVLRRDYQAAWPAANGGAVWVVPPSVPAGPAAGPA